MAAVAAIRNANLTAGRPPAQRRPLWTGTPEIYFSKAIDNSRMVKMEDPHRNLEMKQFCGALILLFVLVFGYTWQHFRAIEYGYQIESAKRDLSTLTEMNHALMLEEASLRDPERIDVLARRMGLVPPIPGQVIRLDGATTDGQGPEMASAAMVTIAGQ